MWLRSLLTWSRMFSKRQPRPTFLMTHSLNIVSCRDFKIEFEFSVLPKLFQPGSNLSISRWHKDESASGGKSPKFDLVISPCYLTPNQSQQSILQGVSVHVQRLKMAWIIIAFIASGGALCSSALAIRNVFCSGFFSVDHATHPLNQQSTPFCLSEILIAFDRQ